MLEKELSLEQSEEEVEEALKVNDYA
jgi:hypothetical protein